MVRKVVPADITLFAEGHEDFQIGLSVDRAGIGERWMGEGVRDLRGI